MATSHLDGLDPASAQTPEAFMQLLREARTASGLSIVEVAEIARRRGYELDPVGLALDLDSPALPSWQTVTGVLTACGLTGMQIDRWMRVYHDLTAPAQPVAPAAPAAPIAEPEDVAPVSVPPLILSTTSATPPRFGAKHFAVAGVALAALIAVPLAVFALSGGEPEEVAGGVTTPRTTQVVPPLMPPAASPTDAPVVEPSPTEAPVPTSAAPTTTRPPVRTTGPAAPPPPPPPPPTTSDPGVLRGGVAALTGNDSFDLDGGRSDIYRAGPDDLGRDNGSWLKTVSGMPSKESCQNGGDWDPWVRDLDVGQWLCVRTAEGRYGRVNITAIGDTLKLTYTVWT